MNVMAARRGYEAEDEVDDYFLNQISRSILYHRLGALARDLGLSQAEFSRIVIPGKPPEDQIFEVSSSGSRNLSEGAQ